MGPRRLSTTSHTSSTTPLLSAPRSCLPPQWQSIASSECRRSLVATGLHAARNRRFSCAHHCSSAGVRTFISMSSPRADSPSRSPSASPGAAGDVDSIAAPVDANGVVAATPLSLVGHIGHLTQEQTKVRSNRETQTQRAGAMCVIAPRSAAKIRAVLRCSGAHASRVCALVAPALVATLCLTRHLPHVCPASM